MKLCKTDKFVALLYNLYMSGLRVANLRFGLLACSGTWLLHWAAGALEGAPLHDLSLTRVSVPIILLSWIVIHSAFLLQTGYATAACVAARVCE